MAVRPHVLLTGRHEWKMTLKICQLVHKDHQGAFETEKMHPTMLIAWLADGLNLVSGN